MQDECQKQAKIPISIEIYVFLFRNVVIKLTVHIRNAGK